jgi:hypothetical protein
LYWRDSELSTSVSAVRAFLLSLVLLLCGGPCLRAADTVPLPEFRFPLPAPVVEQAAEKAGIALAGYDAPVERSEMRQGDTITALVDLTEGQTVRQWVVVIVGKDLTEEEKRRPLPEAVRLFTSTGNEYKFASQLAAVAIHALGPYRIGEKSELGASRRAKDIWSGTFVNPSFLGLGFDRACRADLRVNEVSRRIVEATRKEVTFNFLVEGAPFSADRIAIAKANLREYALTAEEERAMAGSWLALLAFYDIVQRTPGLQDVLASVVDIPWFSILRHGGKMPRVDIHTAVGGSRLNSSQWGLPAAQEIYPSPFELWLNGKAALICQMAVVEPKPPFLTSAGIVGLAAHRPDGNGPQLMIRMLSARCARDPSSSPPPSESSTRH